MHFSSIYRALSGAALAVGLLSFQNSAAFAAGTTGVPASETYPLKTCVVSGEELGGMGKPFDYIHSEPGKPDRLVRFCCKMCLKDFKKDPAKYLARIDAALAAQAEKKP